MLVALSPRKFHFRRLLSGGFTTLMLSRCIGCIHEPAAGRVVEMACARSTSSTILDARKRTREERPEAGPSDARIEQ